jgi:quercetin dioxygenase-like cupin family protein
MRGAWRQRNAIHSKTGYFRKGQMGKHPGSTYVSPETLDWSTDDDGFQVKLLYENLSRGERTLLMKIAPGAFFPMHAHEGEWEQIYVIDGEFHDDRRTIGAGEFVCRSPGAPHTAGSEKGATVLLFYTKAD